MTQTALAVNYRDDEITGAPPRRYSDTPSQLSRATLAFTEIASVAANAHATKQPASNYTGYADGLARVALEALHAALIGEECPDADLEGCAAAIAAATYLPAAERDCIARAVRGFASGDGSRAIAAIHVDAALRSRAPAAIMAEISRTLDDVALHVRAIADTFPNEEEGP